MAWDNFCSSKRPSVFALPQAVQNALLIVTFPFAGARPPAVGCRLQPFRWYERFGAPASCYHAERRGAACCCTTLLLVVFMYGEGGLFLLYLFAHTFRTGLKKLRRRGSFGGCLIFMHRSFFTLAPEILKNVPRYRTIFAPIGEAFTLTMVLYECLVRLMYEYQSMNHQPHV